ncbi:growth arrest and DNA damage-inducible proteins-interacting protein 1-like protein, partial [Dinothrombium tinctorium]
EEKNDTNETANNATIEETKPESKWVHYTDDEIMAIRDKSGLSPQLKAIKNSELSKPERFQYLHQYRENNVRRYYAKYGKKSGLKPGVMWPSKAKFEFIKQFEATFYPSLEKLWADAKAEKEAAEKEIRQREAEIAANLKKLPQLKKEFFAKLESKRLEAEAERTKKEKLIQDIREYLGYDVDPGDIRFQEALLKKEEEDKLKAKAEKKISKQAKLLAKIAEMTAEEKPADSETKQNASQNKKE